MYPYLKAERMLQLDGLWQEIILPIEGLCKQTPRTERVQHQPWRSEGHCATCLAMCRPLRKIAIMITLL